MLRDHPDNAEYVKGMSDWLHTHDVLYHTISDYCPHGGWQCRTNPRAASAYRSLFGHQ